MDQADRVCMHSYHSKNAQSEDNLQLFSDGRIDKLVVSYNLMKV